MFPFCSEARLRLECVPSLFGFGTGVINSGRRQEGHLDRMKKPGETESLPAFGSRGLLRRLGSVPLKLVDFVLDAQLLTLQIVDCVLIRKRTLVFLIESAFECRMFLLQRLDAILQRHARSSC